MIEAIIPNACQEEQKSEKYALAMLLEVWLSTNFFLSLIIIIKEIETSSPR